MMKEGSDIKHMQEHQNRLIHETSPYLRQHAHNPVDWYPWGEEALQKARKSGKPILLSIGYAACHWCHVMAHESFEDPDTARLMNEHFICIKVDREERPDVDQVYMAFVQMTTGSGGWPLNVFLTPDQEPFYGGTYFPPASRYGRPSWKEVLTAVNNYYHNQKSELNTQLEAVRDAFRQMTEHKYVEQMPDENTLRQAAANLSGMYDHQHGGLGAAPKFPAIQPLHFFLHQYHATGEKDYLDMVTTTLRKMALGGIYDHLAGGFARYSVDARWLVPHFEKMLYDNAQLVPLYLDTYVLTKDEFFRRVAEETLEFIIREMTNESGGFYSSLDADSEGEEGKYYVWTREEADRILGVDSPVFCDYYDITETGNFEGKNILHVQTTLEHTASRFNLSTGRVREILSGGRQKLKESRDRRIRPGLDDKILTSWNALMISAFARAYQVTRSKRYREVMIRAIRFIEDKLYQPPVIHRTFSRNENVLPGYLDDYSYLTAALLDAYEAVFDPHYLILAKEIHDSAHERFLDGERPGYYYTPSEQRDLKYRMKDETDQSIPSASGIMLHNHLRLFSLTENQGYMETAEKMISHVGSIIGSNAYAYASYLISVDFYLRKPKEIILSLSQKDIPENWMKSIFSEYTPNKVLILHNSSRPAGILSKSLLEGKQTQKGRPTAYICHNFACSEPITEPDGMRQKLSMNGG